MGRKCVICGKTITTRVESILLNGKGAALVNFGENYCTDCVAKRVEELKNVLKAAKNVLSIAPYLRFEEEMKIIEV